MPAAISIAQMSQLVDALDHEDFPALLLSYLERTVSFDLFALFLYDQAAAPTYLCSNFPAGVKELSLHRFSGRTFRYHPFFQHHLKGIANGIHSLKDLSQSDFLLRPERECDHIRFKSDEEIGYITKGFPDSLKELDITIDLGHGQTLQVGLYRQQRASFSLVEVARLNSLYPLLESLFKRYLKTWLARRAGASREGLHRAGMSDLQQLLSPREAQVVGLIIKGFSSRDISEKLRISAETVKSHRKNAYFKLDVSTTAELASRFLDGVSLASRISGIDNLVGSAGTLR